MITESLIGATDLDDGYLIPRASAAATRPGKCTAHELSWIAQSDSIFKFDRKDHQDNNQVLQQIKFFAIFQYNKRVINLKSNR